MEESKNEYVAVEKTVESEKKADDHKEIIQNEKTMDQQLKES